MITLIMDLANKCWHKSGTAESSNCKIEFYLDMDPGKTPFKNFGHEFLLKGPGAVSPFETGEGMTVTIEAEEIDRTEEEVTTFPYLVERHIIKNLTPGAEYTLELMFKNRREVFEDTFSFTTPKPQKPHPSWIWSEENYEWVAPVSPPSLVWDENNQQWILP